MNMKIEELVAELTDIEKIIPYEKNAKKHSPQQIDILSRLIKKHGWTSPIVVDIDGVIIAGHGRRLAAIKLGLKKLPVIWRRDLNKDDADALRLADNRVVSTEFDTMLEQAELMRLDDAGVSIEDLGYTPEDLSFLLKDLGEMNESAFVDDVSSAVEAQKASNEAGADGFDESAAPIGDALGFKRVTVKQSRIIRDFMGVIESSTGLKGAEALVSHIESYA